MSRKTTDVGLSANKTIYDAIRQIAHHAIINPRTNTTYQGGSVSGYVAKIHDNPSDELYGTIDVKEWDSTTIDTDDITKEGYHEGVRLNAIQDSHKGVVMIPKLYSDVMIGREPESGVEYVTMYSHVDIIQLDAQQTVVIGVKEREEYNNKDENAPDIDDLAETGISAVSTYTKDGIETAVINKNGNKQVLHKIDAESVSFDIANSKTTYKADASEVNTVRDNASISLKSGEIYIKVGSEFVKVATDGVYVGSDSGTSHAVLGEELADLLGDICQSIAQIMTPTMIGPQPPANQVATFIANKAKLSAWKAALSGIISKKVNIQH